MQNNHNPVENVEKVDALQEQGSLVKLPSIIECVRKRKQQSQETEIRTDQNQSFKTENNTDYF